MFRPTCLLFLLASAACATSAKPTPRGPMLPPIVQAGAEVLRRPADPVPLEDIRTEKFQALLAEMTAAMRAAPGVGLAAPQIGVPLRVFVIEDREDLMAALSPADRAERERVPVALRTFINPTVTPVSDEQVTFFEGCLSVAGYAALVPRHREVEVSAVDENAKPFKWRVRGWPARILQHEMDHLNGALYVDRMHSRSFGTLPQVKERFGGKAIADVLKSFGL